MSKIIERSRLMEPDAINKFLGNKMREARLAQRPEMSQRQLGELLGVKAGSPQQTVERWEKGKSTIPAWAIRMLLLKLPGVLEVWAKDMGITFNGMTHGVTATDDIMEVLRRYNLDDVRALELFLVKMMDLHATMSILIGAKRDRKGVLSLTNGQ